MGKREEIKGGKLGICEGKLEKKGGRMGGKRK